jgi:RNA polymerase sigma-70 factor (ECF subfamily)
VQETYTRAMQAMRRLREGSNVKGWLFAILRNIWINRLRKRRNDPQMIEIDVGIGIANNIIEPSKDSHDVYVSKLEIEQVRAAIHQLPAEFREIISLRVYEDLSYREIASILHCPVGTVMSRLSRARAKLRTLLTAAAKSKGFVSHRNQRHKMKIHKDQWRPGRRVSGIELQRFVAACIESHTRIGRE